MRRRSLLFLSVVLVLYILPLNLMLTNGHTTILAQQNTTKDFSLSAGESWLAGWNYRRQFLVGADADIGNNPCQIDLDVNFGSGSSGASVVYLNSHCQTDFDDIRFTESDGYTQVEYWREEYTASDDATFWVNVTLPAVGTEEFYIYYGRGGVSTTSNGTATFPMFEDWADENADNWDTVTGTHGTPDAATWDDTEANSGSVLRLQGGASNAGAGWIWNGTGGMYLTPDHAFMGRIYAEETVTSYQRIYITSGYTAAGPWAGFQTREGVETFNSVDDDENNDPQAMDNAWCDTWTTFQIYRSGTNAYLYWRNGIVDSLEESASLDPDTEETVKGPYIYCRDTEKDLYVDWLAVRMWAGAVEPYPYNWGSEEETESEWNTINDPAIFYLDVPIDPSTLWAMSNWYILGGAFLMIGAGVYLVRGGKDDLSAEKFIIAVMAFLVGISIIIGVITP